MLTLDPRAWRIPSVGGDRCYRFLESPSDVLETTGDILSDFGEDCQRAYYSVSPLRALHFQD